MRIRSLAAALLVAGAVLAPAAAADAAPQYALGSASKHAPYPDCGEATANWTAANGPVWVTVMVEGPVKVHVALTADSVVWKGSKRLSGDVDTHIFVFKKVDPAAVTSVKLTSTKSPFGKAGSCMVTGSPTN